LPTYFERTIWRVTIDTRWTEARIRDVPHGHELRFVIDGEGRSTELMQSVVYRSGESDELATMSTGTLQNFIGHGWSLNDATPPRA
jgi:hypothetical protein